MLRAVPGRRRGCWYRRRVRQLWPERRAQVDLAAVYGADRPTPPGRPWVALNMVTSVDGATSVEGVSEGLSSPSDKQVFHLLRSLADVILVGAGTVRAESYGPPRLDDAEQDARRERGQSAVPRIAVVTRSLDLDFSATLFTEAVERPIIVTSSALPAGRRAAAGNRAKVVTCGDDDVDLVRAMAALAELGARVVLCEGGPKLNGSLLAAGLVDEVCLTMAPQLVGGDADRLATGPDAPAVPLVLDRLLEDEGSLFFRWIRRD